MNKYKMIRIIEELQTKFGLSTNGLLTFDNKKLLRYVLPKSLVKLVVSNFILLTSCELFFSFSTYSFRHRFVLLFLLTLKNKSKTKTN